MKIATERIEQLLGEAMSRTRKLRCAPENVQIRHAETVQLLEEVMNGRRRDSSFMIRPAVSMTVETVA